MRKIALAIAGLVGGSLALAAVPAQADIGLPSSGSSDLILFAEVLDPSQNVVASYAGDTGLSINSIANGFSGSQYVLGADANFYRVLAADSYGDTLYFAVLGGQYPFRGNLNNPGAAQVLTTTSDNSTYQLFRTSTRALADMLSDFDYAVRQIDDNIGGGSASSIEGGTPPASGVWDVNSTGGIAYWNPAIIPNANPLGTAAQLFYVTGGGSSNSEVFYTEVGTATLTSSGLYLTGDLPPVVVPLPASAWLQLSGLAGLSTLFLRRRRGDLSA